MDYLLEDLIDIPLMQSLQEKLNTIYSFPSAIIDNNGKILTAVAWQDLCTKFHRLNPESEKECIKSDRYIFEHLHEANPSVSYQCPNGLIDNAVPIIINGKHLGNFFTGQFFLDKPDLNFFREQAKKYDFDERSYLEAVAKVPIWTKEKLIQYLDFIKEFIEIIAGLGLKNIKEIEILKTIKESEERNRAIIENSLAGYFYIDRDGLFQHVNSAWLKMHKYNNAGEVIGKHFAITQINMDFENAQNIVEEILKGGSMPTGEFSRLCRDNTVGYHLFSCNRVMKDEKVVGIEGFLIDITERKQSEEKLLKSERFLMETQVIANLGTYALNVVSGIWESSEVLDEIFGIDPTYHKTVESWVSIIHPEWQYVMNDYFLNQVIDNKIRFNKEYKIIRQNDKTERWVHGIGNLKFNSVNQPITMVGTVQDITERKQAEIDLMKAKEKAEESDRLKSAFLSNMSHEIRTPMNGILGFAELLKEPDLSIEEQRDFIRTIEKSGERMLNTLNDIIDFSKIESGLTKVYLKESNINEQIDFLFRFFKPEVESKGIHFSFEANLPSKEAIIKTDSEKIYAILTNLVKNAIKFTNEGSIEFGYVKKGKYLEFFVKDTGTGISKKQKKIIFERFRQGSDSLNRNYEGSGLGLSISKSYVEMLDGKIWVESEEGKGSIFYFTIPYNVVEEDKKAIKNDLSEKDNEIRIKTLKILIAEDDNISYSLLIRTLQKINCEILRVKTGAEAIETCRNNPDLDLVLMDIRMPDMDGYEATRNIRKFNKEVIIIAQTAYGFSNDTEEAIEAGCNDYISKPINKSLFYTLIKKYFLNKK